jgi:hypothetical protein
MTSITTRSAKGSALTHAEVDANFTNLNNDKAEVSGQTFTGPVILPAGTAAAPGLAFSGDPNSGLYSAGADQVAISTGGTGRVFVDASGRVGIGTASPRQFLTLGGVAVTLTATPDCIDLGATYSSSSGANMKILTYNDGTVRHGIGVSTSASDYLTASNGAHVFYRGTTESARIDSSGRLLVGLTSANTSGAKLQTSDGLTFPATAIASADPNTLDDYEEGTWTPTIVGSSTAGTALYPSQTGTYTKIGRQVTLTFAVSYFSGTGTGNLRIAGVPFAVSSVYFYSTADLADIVMNANSFPSAVIGGGSSVLEMYQTAVGGGTITPIAYDAAGSIYGSITYSV